MFVSFHKVIPCSHSPPSSPHPHPPPPPLSLSAACWLNLQLQTSCGEKKVIHYSPQKAFVLPWRRERWEGGGARGGGGSSLCLLEPEARYAPFPNCLPTIQKDHQVVSLCSQTVTLRRGLIFSVPSAHGRHFYHMVKDIQRDIHVACCMCGVTQPEADRGL